jgi:hypothetical protein
MHVLRSLLAGGAMLASVGVASAAEPTLLTEVQLDGVTAGFFDTQQVAAISQPVAFNLSQAEQLGSNFFGN